MATEDIEYLIKADDQATAKIKGFSEQTVREMKEIGAKTKASTELAGTLANTLGGTAFGSAAGGIAQLTERMSAFSDVAKDGGAGAFAFKAGMAATVAVIGFEFGQAVGNAIFQTERFQEELAATREEASRLASEATNSFTKMLEKQKELAEFKGEGESFAERLNTELTGLRRNIDAAEKRILEMKSATFQSQNHKENIKTEEANLAALRDRMSAMKGVRQSYVDQNSELHQQLESMRKAAELENARNKTSKDFVNSLADEVARMQMSDEQLKELTISTYARNEAEADLIKTLLDKKDAVLAEKEAQKEAAAEAKKREAEALAAAQKLASEKERIAGLEQSSIENLQKQLITMQDGKAAGEAYALQLQGLDSNVANQIANVQEMIDQANGINTKVGPAGEVQAKESRLLSGRGTGLDKAEADRKLQIQLQQKQEKLQNEANKKLEVIIQALKGGRELVTFKG